MSLINICKVDSRIEVNYDDEQNYFNIVLLPGTESAQFVNLFPFEFEDFLSQAFQGIRKAEELKGSK